MHTKPNQWFQCVSSLRLKVNIFSVGLNFKYLFLSKNLWSHTTTSQSYCIVLSWWSGTFVKTDCNVLYDVIAEGDCADISLRIPPTSFVAFLLIHQLLERDFQGSSSLASSWQLSSSLTIYFQDVLPTHPPPPPPCNLTVNITADFLDFSFKKKIHS